MLRNFAHFFAKQYELCKLKEGETVALLTDPRTDRMVADVAHAIACDMGAVPYELLVRGIDDRFMNSDPFHAPGLVDTLCQADLILCFFVGFFSTWEAPARAAGARVLNVLDHPSAIGTSADDSRNKIRSDCRRQATAKRAHGARDQRSRHRFLMGSRQGFAGHSDVWHGG